MKYLSAVSRISLGTLLSRVLGFIRDMTWAMLLGSTNGFEAFLVAYRIPNFLRGLFVEGAFSQAFVPILSTVPAGEERQRFAGAMALQLSLIVGVFILPFLLVPHVIVRMFAPGFSLSDPRLAIAVKLLRITIPFLWCMTFSGILTSMLNVNRCFTIPPLMPVVLNVSLIVGSYYVLDYGVQTLAYAVLVAGIVQVLILVGVCKYYGCLLKWNAAKDQRMRRFWLTMMAAVLGASFQQLNNLFDSVIGSFLDYGGISWLYFAQRLVYLPLGLIAVSVITILTPILSESHQKGNSARFQDVAQKGIVYFALIGFPATVGLLSLSHEIVVTLFLHGKFDWNDVYQTSAAVQALVWGMPAFMMVKLAASICYSRGDVWIVVRATLISVFSYIILSLLVRSHWQHVGLAWASACSALVHCMVVWGYLFYRKIVFIRRETRLVVCGSLIAACVMGIVIKLLSFSLHAWANGSTLWRVSHLLISIGIGVLVYVVLLEICRVPWRKQLAAVM